MIGIINYGLGNIAAIKRAFDLIGVESDYVDNSIQIDKCSHLILPGVGSFDDSICRLEKSKLISSLEDYVFNRGLNIVGICVGMQILFESSEEGNLDGLGWIKGKVKRFNENPYDADRVLPYPHMGWNKIKVNSDLRICDGLDNNEFYFLHSYYCSPNDINATFATSNYGIDFSAAVNKNNIYGIQFHPEKSHKSGLKLFKNFSLLN